MIFERRPPGISIRSGACFSTSACWGPFCPAFTPGHPTAFTSAADPFRPYPMFDVQTGITELGTGEALNSFLEEIGAPGVVERALVLPPRSRIWVITPEERL